MTRGAARMTLGSSDIIPGKIPDVKHRLQRSSQRLFFLAPYFFRPIFTPRTTREREREREREEAKLTLERTDRYEKGVEELL